MSANGPNQRQYWHQNHKRAFTSTCHQLLGRTVGAVIVKAILAITVIVVLWLFSPQTAWQKLLMTGASLGAVGLVFPMVYIWHLIRAPAINQAEADAKIEKLEWARAQLSIGDPYSVPNSSPGAISWRIKIRNAGASAVNIHMNLCNIFPRPRSPYWDADYPYHIAQIGRILDSNECHIHRGGEAIFELCRVEPAAHNTGFLTTLNTRIPGSNRVKIEPGEQWEKMEYVANAENADALKFILRMHTNANGVAFEKINNVS